MAVISLVFSGTPSCPKTNLALLASALSVCSALSPLRVSWVRHEVLPSMAIRSCRSGQSAAIQFSKQRPNRTGSMRLTNARSQRTHGIPK
jgi:hypothetical protein